MKNSYTKAALILLIIVVGLYLFLRNDNKTEDDHLSPSQISHIEEKEDLIFVIQPKPLVKVTSPLIIEGQARGTWFFEGDFPISIVDANDNILGMHYATAQNEWMTTEFVPFVSELNFSNSQTEMGTLILHKDNPSDLRELDDELRIPIRFAVVADDDTSIPVINDTPEERTIKLYYYNPELDQDDDENIMCSEQGLVAVERNIPFTQTPLQDTVKLLIQGDLTADEIQEGITTEYPLEGFNLIGVTTDQDGVLVLNFEDPNYKTTGGSCRTGILWLQIKHTAEQFSGIDEVRFAPEELFQP